MKSLEPKNITGSADKIEPLGSNVPSTAPGADLGKGKIENIMPVLTDKVISETDEWAGYPLLGRLNGPADLKKYSIAQLKQLAEEVRKFILETVSDTGGHLASNLGVVEITIALHYVFDFEQDKLLWDVGHQCYAHKIVTGRKESFRNLRQAGGISGFPNPQESKYDQFAVGHAGTSIGTAIGMALGQAKQGRVEKIVTLTGDASIVNGASFEALNNLGLVKRQLLIVLNDNSMAIDPTQGAVAKYLSKIRLSHTYEDFRKTTSDILEHTPFIGKSVEEAIAKIKKSIRMALPASQLFESLNIPYFGPVDGHDISSLIELFTALKQAGHPVILHCHTKKGMGWTPANDEPSKFHSTGPFEIQKTEDGGQRTDSEEQKTEEGKRTFTEVFGRELARLAQRDKRVVAISSAMCDGTGLMEFRSRFGDRFFDVGIAESAAVEIAAGMAKSGLKPFVCIYSTFLQRSFDQIFQEVSLQNLPVVFCIDRAGMVGADGPTHHGLMDIGFLRMMPNIVLLSPADAIEMKGALEFALGCERPVCIRYPKDYVSSGRISNSSDEPFTLGKSVFTRRGQNTKAIIVSYGGVLTEAMEAAKNLSQEDIEVDVINARFAAPIDSSIIDMIGLGKPIVTVEDHGSACGFGSAILEAAGQRARAFENAGKVRILGAPKRFIRHDSRHRQLMESGVNADKIAETIRQMLE